MSGKPWYYARNNQQQGPVDEDVIRQLLQNNTINMNSMVWQEGMPNWAPLQSTSLQAIIPPTQPAATPVYPVAPVTPAAPIARSGPPATAQTSGFSTKARIITQPAKVYSTPDSNSFPITELMIGTEVSLGKVVKKGGLSWVTVALPNGERGYIPGGTKVFTIKLATVQQKDVKVYSEASMFSVVKAQYKKNTKLYLMDVVNQDGQSWIKVRDMAGVEGFIDGKTRTTTTPVINKATGKKNMLYGGLWCIGGIVVTAGTFSAATSSGGGTYFIAWGAILFGGIQFIQGLIQFLTAPD